MLRSLIECGLSCWTYTGSPYYDYEAIESESGIDDSLRLLDQRSSPQAENVSPTSSLDALSEHHRFTLSKIFIDNINKSKLAEHFSDQEEITILDIGCGFAPTLLGILTYFGESKIRYIGVDANNAAISYCSKMYENFNNLKFIHTDALEKMKEMQSEVDLVLLQHPVLYHSRREMDEFSAIFQEAQRILKENGIVYSTIYYHNEQEVLKKVHSGAGIEGIYRVNNETWFYEFNKMRFYPERYTFTSLPKLTPSPRPNYY